MNRISLILSCLLLVCNMAWCQVSNQLQKNDAAVFQVKHTTDEGKAMLWKVRLKVLSAEAAKMKVEFSTYDYETPITGNAQLQNLTQEQIAAILEQVKMMSHAVINYQDGKPVGVENMAEIRAAVPNLMNEVLSAEAKKKGESQKIVEQMKPLTDMLVGMIQKAITEKSVITQYQDFLQTFYLKDTGKQIMENESGIEKTTIVEPTAANGEYSFRQLANTKLDKAKLKALTEKKAAAGQEGNIEQLSDAIGEALSAIIDSVDAVTINVQKRGMLAKNGIVNCLTIVSATEISVMGETVTGNEQTEIVRTDQSDGNQNGRESYSLRLDTLETNLLVKKKKEWEHSHTLFIFPSGDAKFQKECCSLLWKWNDKISTFKEYEEALHNSAKMKIEWSQKAEKDVFKNKSPQISFRMVIPQGDLVKGRYQNFVLKKSYTIHISRLQLKQTFPVWSLVYDVKEKKILSVSDIFKSSNARDLMNQAGQDFINIKLSEDKVYCGITELGEPPYYDSLTFVGNERILNKEFLSSIGLQYQPPVLQQRDRSIVAKQNVTPIEAIPHAGAAGGDGVKVFDVVEQMPEFPGGQAALMEWLGDNVKYPAIAEENGIQGRVICTFVVERDGSVTDVQVARSIDPSLDKEAVRVLKKMPKWNPGKHNGKAVRVKYTVPVTFRLDMPTPTKKIATPIR